jgi:hypothetical protein
MKSRMRNIHLGAMEHGAIHTQSKQNRRGEEDRLFREMLRMRAFPKTAARDDHHVIDRFSAALLSPFVSRLSTPAAFVSQGRKFDLLTGTVALGKEYS